MQIYLEYVSLSLHLMNRKGLDPVPFKLRWLFLWMRCETLVYGIANLGTTDVKPTTDYEEVVNIRHKQMGTRELPNVFPTIIVLRTVYCVHCTAYSVQCTAYIVLRTVYCVHCTAYSVQCTAYCVQCTAYSVLRTVYCV